MSAATALDDVNTDTGAVNPDHPTILVTCPGCGNDAIYVAPSTLALSGPVLEHEGGYKVHQDEDGAAYVHPKP